RDLGEAEGYLADIHRRFAEHSLYQWGVAKRDDDRVIGTCSLFDLGAPHKRAEIGFAIHRAEWRKGFASEASGAIAQYAFDVLRLHRLDADVDPRNHGSIRCLEGLGFQKEGYARECYHVGDEIQDSVLYGLLARELHRR
ncbi:MAG TPA: GNAT family N-acetyltransferase, partial [Thermoanaerobaculia bacterium]